MSEKHTKTISVEGTEITILQIDDTDYICITDMLSASKPEPGAMAEPTLTKTSLLSLLCGSARNLKYIWCATFSG